MRSTSETEVAVAFGYREKTVAFLIISVRNNNDPQFGVSHISEIFWVIYSRKT